MPPKTKQGNKRDKALLAWLNTLELKDVNPDIPRPFQSIEVCYDPFVLAEVCQTVDAIAFDDVSIDDHIEDEYERMDGWNRLIIAVEEYFHAALFQPTWAMPELDVEGLGQKSNIKALVELVKIILAMAVLSPVKEQQIIKIQSTPEWVQKELMLCIEEVRSSLPVRDPDLVAVEVADGKSDTLASYVELHTAYKALQESYASMKSELEEEKDSHAEYLKLTAEVRQEAATGDGKMEKQYKAEIDRLQGELVKAERIIADAEQSSARQASDIDNLSKQVDDLSIKATQADKLKDEVDEYRHAAEKLRKAETSVEKLKKKLEDSAEVKRQIKVLEDDNLTLMQKNSQLERDLEAREDSKALLDQYKSAAQELEINNRELAKEKEALQLSHRDDQTRLTAMLEEKEKHAETVSLLEERIRQLEASQQGTTSASRVRGSEEAGSDEEDSANELSGIANELDDALSGVTTTELKLKIRKLQRDLEAATSNKAQSSRILVLETLLEDMQKMKTRYEQDFLKEYREKLIMQRKLDEIRNGKSVGNDSAEAVTALRMRLAETVEELDKLRLEHAAQMEELDHLRKDAATARADLKLVGKDQTDILAELRESVSTEKASLEEELASLHIELKSAQQKATMQLSQINSLLLDKVDGQSKELASKEKMLTIKIPSPSSSVAGVNLEQSHQYAVILRERDEQLEQVRDQLKKARSFIRQQDKLFKEQHQAQASAAHGDRQSEIDALHTELIKQKSLNAEIEQKYQKEQRLLITAYQEAGLDKLCSQVLASGQTATRSPPVSWLAQQRARALYYSS